MKARSCALLGGFEQFEHIVLWLGDRERHDRATVRAEHLGIARGLNALWTKGGLQYAPPIR